MTDVGAVRDEAATVHGHRATAALSSSIAVLSMIGIVGLRGGLSEAVSCMVGE